MIIQVLMTRTRAQLVRVSVYRTVVGQGTTQTLCVEWDPSSPLSEREALAAGCMEILKALGTVPAWGAPDRAPGAA
jgi:hypothetical protein